LHNSYFLEEDGLFFSSLRGVGPTGRRPRLSGWSFQQLIYGGVLPSPRRKLYEPEALRIAPTCRGNAVSPTDKLRKDSTLTPVTSEKSTLFIGVPKIVRFCKALMIKACQYLYKFMFRAVLAAFEFSI